MISSLKKLRRVLAQLDRQGVSVRELFALSEYEAMKVMATEIVENDPTGASDLRDSTRVQVDMYANYSDVAETIAETMNEICAEDFPNV